MSTRRLKWKKLQIILVLISEFFVVSQLNYFVLKVVDLKPFNDTWRKKRSVGNYRHRRNLIGNV
jgi:hypothetical protein